MALETGQIIGLRDFGSFVKEDGFIIGNVGTSRVVAEILDHTRFKIVAIADLYDKKGEPIFYDYGET